MNIGDVAAISGLNPKTIRYYESRGFLQPLRSTNGYRYYRESDVRRLRILAEARKLGFSLSDCETLLDVFETDGAETGVVVHLLQAQLDTLDRDIQDLERKKMAICSLLANSAPKDGGNRDLLEFLSEQADRRVHWPETA